MSSLLEGLNENQKQAVTSNSPVILCLAGAGSGKTTVLTRRIAHLHQEYRVGTVNMLALTFTRLAGKEMKERIMRLIGEEQGKKLFVNTFHAFAVAVLRRWGYKLGIDENFTIYDQEDREAILRIIIEEFGNRVTLKKVLDRQANCIDYREEQKKYPEECRILTEYGYRCKQNNAVDLDRLIDLVVRLWQLHPDVLEEYQQNYTHVFIDEFQDTNDEQMTMIELLHPQHIFFVGDDFQSIYGWRGSRVEFIIDLPKYRPDCEVIKLEDNYRSTEQIVAAANRLIRHNVNQTEKKLFAHKAGIEVVTYQAKDSGEEATNIAALIKTLINNPATAIFPKDIAILARTNNQIDNIKHILEDARIPVLRVSGKDDPFKAPAVRPIMNWLYFLHNRKNNVSFKKCARQSGVTGLQIAALEINAIQQDMSMYDAGKSFGIDEFYQFIRLWEAQESTGRPSHEFQLLKELLQINDHPDIDKALHMIAVWEASKMELGENCLIQAFLKFLRYRDIQEKLIEQKDAVKLMTVHASKGLEFDTVFVAGMNQGIFPSKRGDIEEERRLFYVAVTRAKNRLYITWPDMAPDWRGSPVKVKPSQFLNEIS
ncbi:MAG: ATP-dependent helicase [Veillonellales bacterium]